MDNFKLILIKLFDDKWEQNVTGENNETLMILRKKLNYFFLNICLPKT